MASARERRDIMYNIIGRVGLDGDVLGEYAKALRTINGMKTYNELNPPQAPIVPPQPTNQPLSGQGDTTMSPLGDNGLSVSMTE